MFLECCGGSADVPTPALQDRSTEGIEKEGVYLHSGG